MTRASARPRQRGSSRLASAIPPPNAEAHGQRTTRVPLAQVTQRVPPVPADHGDVPLRGVAEQRDRACSLLPGDPGHCNRRQFLGLVDHHVAEASRPSIIRRPLRLSHRVVGDHFAGLGGARSDFLQRSRRDPGPGWTGSVHQFLRPVTCRPQRHPERCDRLAAPHLAHHVSLGDSARRASAVAGRMPHLGIDPFAAGSRTRIFRASRCRQCAAQGVDRETPAQRAVEPRSVRRCRCGRAARF